MLVCEDVLHLVQYSFVSGFNSQNIAFSIFQLIEIINQSCCPTFFFSFWWTKSLLKAIKRTGESLIVTLKSAYNFQSSTSSEREEIGATLTPDILLSFQSFYRDFKNLLLCGHFLTGLFHSYNSIYSYHSFNWFEEFEINQNNTCVRVVFQSFLNNTPKVSG